MLNNSELNSWLNNGAHIVYADTAKPTKRITTLGEVFLEYYLFDASAPKSISEFLQDEKLDDIFMPQQIMDLMCGTAYLNDDFIVLLHANLPFEISLGRLHKLNTNAKNSGAIEIMPHDINLAHKEEQLKQEKVRRAKAEYNRRYREKYAAEIKAHQKELYQKNRAEYQAKARARYYKNREANNIKSREYYQKNYVACSARDKKYYQDNRDYILARNQRYRTTHPSVNKDNYQKIKARKELAQSMCPVFMFVCELRTTNLQKYLTKYKRVQDIPGQTIRAGCMALGCGDYKLCPIVTGGVDYRDDCPMPMRAAFEIRGAVGRITEYAKKLKQNQK